jgi:hypothetical protein
MSIEEIAKYMLSISATVKIYHWQTVSYARHTSSDQLFQSLQVLIDKFMEVLQGVYSERLYFSKSRKIKLDNVSDLDIVDVLSDFRDWLLSMDDVSSELSNIRDDIVTEISKTLYLFTFN